MKETLKDKIVNMFELFSKGEQKVAKYVVDHYQEILSLSSGELAKIAGVSDATVVRFAKTLGYKGFVQLRTDLKEEFGNIRRPYYISQAAGSHIDDQTINDYFTVLEEDAKAFSVSVDMGQLDRLVDHILHADTVYLFGLGSDRIVVDYLSNYFPLLGIRTVCLSEEGLGLREKVLCIDKNDFMLMASYPTVQDDEYWVADYAKENKAGVFLITDSDVTAKSLGVCDYVKTRSTVETYYNSCVLSMYFCDILLMKLREQAGQKAEACLKKYDAITKK